MTSPFTGTDELYDCGARWRSKIFPLRPLRPRTSVAFVNFYSEMLLIVFTFYKAGSLIYSDEVTINPNMSNNYIGYSKNQHYCIF